jgi:glycosyltransferase involved in cell wall biosynthesis
LISSVARPSGGKPRVALFATHPIQYHVPWFRALSARDDLSLKVFFGQVPDAKQQGVGFGVDFQWDIPLLDGYVSEVLNNVASPPSLGTFDGCDTPHVAGRLREWEPDLAILTGWQSKMLVQAWWACVRLRVPRIVRGESNSMARRAPWKRAMHRAWLRGFDRFLAIGRANRDFYLGAGIAPSRIHPCPYFVDNRRFADAARLLREHRTGLRSRWSIPESATCFLFCGKLIPKKHPLDLLRALERAVAAGAPAHVLIAGDGELMSEGRALAATARLPVTFAGFMNQTEVVSAYVAADCLVLPSDAGETWGLVVNEAMACGIPAIVSDHVGCGPDLVEDGVTGLAFPLGDIAALAEHLTALARDASRLRAMGAKACEHGLCRALAARGHDVHVFTTNVDGASDSEVPLSKPVGMDGVNVWYFPSSRLRRLYWSPPMGRMLRRETRGFDLVHLHSVFLWPTWAAARASRRARVPYVLSPRGMLVADLLRARSRYVKAAWIATIERNNLAHAAGIHVTSAVERSEIERLRFRLSGRLFEVPNGVDVLPELPISPVAVSPYLLMMGRINWKKRIEIGLDVVKLVAGIRLVIAGGDEERLSAALRERAAAQGIAARVEFVGPVEGAQKRELLSAALALLMPSLSENFGNSALEAMAEGTPVITVPGVGVADAVAASGSGFVVAPDASALAAPVRKLLADPELRSQLGRCGRKAVVASFSWPAIASRMEDEYRAILARHSAA